MQPRPLGGLRPLCALAAVAAVAAWPAAAGAQLDAGRSGAATTSAAEAPQIWGVEADAYSAPFLRPAYVDRMRKAGVNALVVDPTKLTAQQLTAALKAARRGKLRLIEVVPPASARSTRSVRAVR